MTQAPPAALAGRAKAPSRTSTTGSGVDRSRYSVMTRAEQRFLVCGGNEGVHVHVERGLSVNEAGRKRYPERTIFLDGAFCGPPFYDNKSRQYSLDHHAGCVRAFTLATCEQAAVMILQGLPLDDGEWGVYLNEPDLDAVLAAWILLNHGELLRDDATLLRRAMPLIRVEGIIDAHGLNMGALSGLRDELYDEQKRRIDQLLTEERSLKASSAWASADHLQYTQGLLDRLDTVLFPAGHLARLLQVKELHKVPLQGGHFAVLCRSTQGIYQVEELLKQRHEKQLGIIILEVGHGRFTLRQVNRFLDHSLRGVYELLNQRDPRASKEAAEDNLWGGSDEIGGSPRRTGSGLTGEQVLRAVQQVYGKGEGWLGRLLRHLTPAPR